VVAGVTHDIKQILDVGAQTILVPMVETALQAQEMVRAVRYPPTGIRGAASITRAAKYGNTPNYAASANDEICLLVQAESQAALDNLEAICAVEGVDGVFIGPFDLAASMGFINDPNNELVQNAIEQAIVKIISCGKAAGILMSDEVRAKKYIEMGALFVAVGTDVSTFLTGANSLISKYKNVKKAEKNQSIY
jgi:4-hydroxy-2-oxoheptanedioate aldolase